jgi:PIN domain nuclease of toxin-antitoxin system
LRLLLDTHVFLWWWQASRQLKPPARRSIAAAEDVLVSAVSAWEMAIKIGLGRLRFEGSMSDALTDCRFAALPVGFAHAERYLGLPAHHTDPFDRMLVAQALVEGLTLVTHDRRLEAYDVPLLRT